MNDSRIELLQLLDKHLEYGDAVTLAERTGFKREYVTKCLSPGNATCYNQDIIEAAVKLVKERTARQNQLINDLKNLPEALPRNMGVGVNATAHLPKQEA